jgi:hypothetical protein
VPIRKRYKTLIPKDPEDAKNVVEIVPVPVGMKQVFLQEIYLECTLKIL